MMSERMNIMLAMLLFELMVFLLGLIITWIAKKIPGIRKLI